MDGRFSVAIDDIKKVAIPVLRHRISTNFQAQAEGKTSEDVINQLLAAVGEPDVGKYEKKKK
jgi:MoxR-like ATPase